MGWLDFFSSKKVDKDCDYEYKTCKASKTPDNATGTTQVPSQGQPQGQVQQPGQTGGKSTKGSKKSKKTKRSKTSKKRTGKKRNG